jgi:allose kinase
MQAGSIIAVDIGGTHVRAGAANRAGAIGTREKFSTQRLKDDPVGVLVKAIRGQMADLPAPAAGVVVGIPGFRDETSKVVIKAPNVPSLNGLALADLLSSACGLPVWLEHDVTLRIRGEHACGSAEGFDLVFGVFFGTGIGAALLERGRPWKGGAYSMELGHIPLRGEGRRCGCGGIDCVEAYASGAVLQAIAHQFDIPVDQLFARRPDMPGLDRVLSRFIEDQAIAVATGVMLFDPQVVVLGGGVIDMAGYPKQELFDYIRRHLSPVHDASKLRFEIAKLGWLAVLHGAISVADQKSQEADRQVA